MNELPVRIFLRDHDTAVGGLDDARFVFAAEGIRIEPAQVAPGFRYACVLEQVLERARILPPAVAPAAGDRITFSDRVLSIPE